MLKDWWIESVITYKELWHLCFLSVWMGYVVWGKWKDILVCLPFLSMHFCFLGWKALVIIQMEFVIFFFFPLKWHEDSVSLLDIYKYNWFPWGCFSLLLVLVLWSDVVSEHLEFPCCSRNLNEWCHLLLLCQCYCVGLLYSIKWASVFILGVAVLPHCTQCPWVESIVPFTCYMDAPRLGSLTCNNCF